MRSNIAVEPKMLGSWESDRAESRNASSPFAMGFALIIVDRYIRYRDKARRTTRLEAERVRWTSNERVRSITATSY